MRSIRILAGFALGALLAFGCVWLVVSRTGLDNSSGSSSFLFVLLSGVVTLVVLSILSSATVRRK